MHKKHSSCLWCSGFLADGSWPFFTPDHTAKCTYGCRKKNQQVFLYCLSSALWTHHYWPDCETWQVVSKPPREKTAQRLWTGARRFRQTKSICLHRDPATWTHRYLFVQWVKQHRQYWISAETPHANIFQLISADSSGWALGFCAPKCWGEIWPRLEFYIQAYMIPNVRFQREAQWVTLLLRTCVFTGPNLASICVRRGPSGLLLAVGQWVSGRSAAGKCTPSSWTAQQCVMYSPSEDRNGKSVFLKQYCSCSVGRCKDCEKLVARYETYSSLHRHTDMAADRQEAGTDRTASSYSSVSWLDKMCSDTRKCVFFLLLHEQCEEQRATDKTLNNSFSEKIFTYNSFKMQSPWTRGVSWLWSGAVDLKKVLQDDLGRKQLGAPVEQHCAIKSKKLMGKSRTFHWKEWILVKKRLWKRSVCQSSPHEVI